MSYWKGLGVAVAIDLIWIMGCPLLATEPPLGPQREPVQQVAQLALIGRLEDSLMERLQGQPHDVERDAETGGRLREQWLVRSRDRSAGARSTARSHAAQASGPLWTPRSPRAVARR